MPGSGLELQCQILVPLHPSRKEGEAKNARTPAAHVVELMLPPLPPPPPPPPPLPQCFVPPAPPPLLPPPQCFVFLCVGGGCRDGGGEGGG